MKFRDLAITQKFDFVSPNAALNSFYLRCQKISARVYADETGARHNVGSINAQVYHFEETEAPNDSKRANRSATVFRNW